MQFDMPYVYPIITIGVVSTYPQKSHYDKKQTNSLSFYSFQVTTEERKVSPKQNLFSFEIFGCNVRDPSHTKPLVALQFTWYITNLHQTSLDISDNLKMIY